jgi:hypothetical protein
MCVRARAWVWVWVWVWVCTDTQIRVETLAGQGRSARRRRAYVRRQAALAAAREVVLLLLFSFFCVLLFSFFWVCVLGLRKPSTAMGLSSCVALPGALFLCLRLSASVCACFPCFWHLLVHMLSHLLVHMRASHAHACTRRTWRMLRGLDGLLSNGVLSKALLS